MKRTKTLEQLREQYERLWDATKDYDRGRRIKHLYWRYKDNMLAHFRAKYGTPGSGSIMWLSVGNAAMLGAITNEPVNKRVYMRAKSE